MTEQSDDPWSYFSPEQIENLQRAEDAAAVELAGFDRWLLLGSALHDLQQEAMRRSNSQNPQGRRYGDMWDWLVHRTPHLARIPHPERSDAIWLHSNRETVVAWHRGLAPKQRDRLRTPRVIKRHVELALTEGGEPINRRAKEPKKARGQAAAIDEAVVDLRDVTDDLVRVNAGAAALGYDLSTPELTAESARNFIEVYSAERARRFAVALLAILDPPAPTPRRQRRKRQTQPKTERHRAADPGLINPLR